MNYIDKLSSFTNFGNKKDKTFLKKYFAKIKNPQNKFKVIHVTGTAGKGSTSSMIANGLKEAGYKVGLFTSPHLIKINERIKINNKNISDKKLNEYIKFYFKKFPNLSFSQYLTLIMLKYFSDENIDYLICEVFVGGKNDTTNIFKQPIATIISSIGLDHKKFLGNTTNKILNEKLGIIKKNSILFTRLNNEIVIKKTEKIQCKYFHVKTLKNTNLKGKFQKENAGIAFEVLKYLNINEKIIKKSLNNVSWPGRIQFLEKNILVDCAHNTIGMQALYEYVKKYKNSQKINNIYYLFALSNNKNLIDYKPYLKNAKEIIYTKPKMFKIQDPNNYIKTNNSNNNNLKKPIKNNEKIIENTFEAFKYLKEKIKKNDLLIVCGSIFLASKILTIYSDKN